MNLPFMLVDSKPSLKIYGATVKNINSIPPTRPFKRSNWPMSGILLRPHLPFSPGHLCLLQSEDDTPPAG